MPRVGRRTIRGRVRRAPGPLWAATAAGRSLAEGIGLPLQSVTTIPVSELRAELDLHMHGVGEDVAGIIRPYIKTAAQPNLVVTKFTQQPKARHFPVT